MHGETVKWETVLCFNGSVPASRIMFLLYYVEWPVYAVLRNDQCFLWGLHETETLCTRSRVLECWKRFLSSATLSCESDFISISGAKGTACQTVPSAGNTGPHITCLKSLLPNVLQEIYVLQRVGTKGTDSWITNYPCNGELVRVWVQPALGTATDCSARLK
jgi:hypothetical protein